MPTPKPKPKASKKPAPKQGDLAASAGLTLEYRDPGTLTPNPANWRTHPEGQYEAVAGSIAFNGWSEPLLLNSRTGFLVDGHLRRKIALDRGDRNIPVVVGDWTEEQERTLLATLDPMAEMAQSDAAAFRSLTESLTTQHQALDDLLDDLRSRSFEDEISQMSYQGNLHVQDEESSGDADEPGSDLGQSNPTPAPPETRLRTYNLMLTEDQYEDVVRGVNAVKAQHGLATAAQAIALLCRAAAET